jgi:hypothetical protein
MGHMPKCIVVLLTALSLCLASCGDGTFIIRVNSGLIVDDPRCQGAGGNFDLRQQGGLVVLVVITGTTRIFVSGGGTGTCSDLSAGAAVDVSGRQSGDRIVATSITVGTSPP